MFPRTVPRELLNIFKDGDSKMSWGTVLSHTHIKNMLPDVQGEPPVFQCVPSPDEKPIMNTPTPNLRDKLNM